MAIKAQWEETKAALQPRRSGEKSRCPQALPSGKRLELR